MDFEELKVAWKSQEEDSAIVIDQDALHASVERKAAEADRQAGWMEAGGIGAGFVLGSIFLMGFLLSVFLFRDQGLYNNAMDLILAVVCLRLGFYTWRGRRRRLANNTVIDQSMLGSVERSQQQLDYYARHAWDLIWFYLLPLAVLSAISLTLFLDQSKPWIWIPTGILCLYAIWETRRDLRERVFPERKNLIYLRDKLLEQA